MKHISKILSFYLQIKSRYTQTKSQKNTSKVVKSTARRSGNAGIKTFFETLIQSLKWIRCDSVLKLHDHCRTADSCRMLGKECSVEEQQFKSFIFLAYVILNLDYYVLFEFCCEYRQNYAFPHGFFYVDFHHYSV